MRRFVVTVFDDWVYSTPTVTHTSDAHQLLLGSCDQLAVQVIADRVNTAALLTVSVESTSNGTHWTPHTDLLSRVDISPSQTNLFVGAVDSTPKLRNVRIGIQVEDPLGGIAQARVRIIVCGRDSSRSTENLMAWPAATARGARVQPAPMASSAATIEATMFTDSSSCTGRSRASPTSCAKQASRHVKASVDRHACSCSSSSDDAKLNRDAYLGASPEACSCSPANAADSELDFDSTIGTPPTPAMLPTVGASFAVARYAHAFATQPSQRLAHDGFASSVQGIDRAASRRVGIQPSSKQLPSDAAVQRASTDSGTSSSPAGARNADSFAGAGFAGSAIDFDSLVGTPPAAPMFPTPAQALVAASTHGHSLSFQETQSLAGDGFGGGVPYVGKAWSRPLATTIARPALPMDALVQKTGPLHTMPTGPALPPPQPKPPPFEPAHFGPFKPFEPGGSGPNVGPIFHLPVELDHNHVLQFWLDPAIAGFVGPPGPGGLIMEMVVPPRRSYAWSLEDLSNLPFHYLRHVHVKYDPVTDRTKVYLFAYDPSSVTSILEHTWPGQGVYGCSGGSLKGEMVYGYPDWHGEYGPVSAVIAYPWNYLHLDADQWAPFWQPNVWGPPASDPDGEGSVKAVRLYDRGECARRAWLGVPPNTIGSEEMLLKQITDRFWCGTLKEIATANIEAENATGRPDELECHPLRAMVFLDNALGDPTNLWGGFHMDGTFTLHWNEPFVPDYLDVCFIAHYQFILRNDQDATRGLFGIFPLKVVVTAEGLSEIYHPTKAEWIPVMQPALDALSDALLNKIPTEFNATALHAQLFDIGLECDPNVWTLAEGPCSDFVVGGTLDAIIDEAIQNGNPPFPPNYFTATEIAQLRNTAKELNLDGTSPLGDGCGPFHPGGTCTPFRHFVCKRKDDDPNVNPTCHIVVRAKRLNVYPDYLELVFFDGKEVNNPAYVLWVALHSPSVQALGPQVEIQDVGPVPLITPDLLCQHPWDPPPVDLEPYYQEPVCPPPYLPPCGIGTYRRSYGTWGFYDLQNVQVMPNC